MSVVWVDSSSGDLVLQPPGNDALNTSLNVSLACFTELARGTRNITDLGACIRYTLNGMRIYFWPLRVHFPWESPEQASVVGYDASASAPTTPGGVGMHADHTDHADDHHHHDPYYASYYASGAEAVFLFLVLGLVLLICGFAITDAYAYNGAYDGNAEWRYDRGAYRRVEATVERAPGAVANRREEL